jgi:hypothetical protein
MLWLLVHELSNSVLQLWTEHSTYQEPNEAAEHLGDTWKNYETATYGTE